MCMEPGKIILMNLCAEQQWGMETWRTDFYGHVGVVDRKERGR